LKKKVTIKPLIGSSTYGWIKRKKGNIPLIFLANRQHLTSAIAISLVSGLRQNFQSIFDGKIKLYRQIRLTNVFLFKDFIHQHIFHPNDLGGGQRTKRKSGMRGVGRRTESGKKDSVDGS